MKQTKLLAGRRGRDVLRIVPAALLACVLAVSCENPWVIKLTDSLVEEKDGPSRPTFSGPSAFAAFAAWLAAQPPNSPANPYTVKLNVDDLGGGADNPGSVGYTLFDSGKYVYLDLSGSNLTTIGVGAFFECSNLTGITIPNSVTTIGSDAFIGCIKLSSVTIGNSVTAIKDYAFHQCFILISITIPASVTSIGVQAFSECLSLTSVRFGSGSNITNANFGDLAFPEGSNGAGGDTLRTAYNSASAKAGTYTRPNTASTTWTKQP